MDENTVTTWPSHRFKPDPICLPQEPEAARAVVLQFINSGDASTVERASALDAMNRRIAQLQSDDGNSIERELLAHSAIADALYIRFAATAVDCPSPDHKLRYLKAAMQAQAAYTRCIGAASQLRSMRTKTTAIDA